MAMRISPKKISDGTGRDTYIHLDESYLKGEATARSNFHGDLRDHVPDGMRQHGKGYLSWWPRGKRPGAFAPICQPPSQCLAASSLKKTKRPLTTGWEERLCAINTSRPGSTAMSPSSLVLIGANRHQPNEASLETERQLKKILAEFNNDYLSQ
eukprot:CAMPEP_0206464594 /NCGR_PEP_ID=MMETSP0324_2-20121206/27312_1 /ASSEMBLY_ACC=CAM_ASM_000836 /TAXON_ID=2866 /ORGANISM="Crypthecodinium cohnii, Strain Seligo" /LENGTH=153 /DNA_ID=CAMNT_0053937261 /DNA_START=78 /DNA_END=539 /DNA_ORIENTATION=-